MSVKKKGIIEAISWKAIVSAILAVVGLYFGIPEYVLNARPALETRIGSGPVWFIEGAIVGASTVLLVLKLYSQFSSKKEKSAKVPKASDPRLLKKRIKEELQILKEQISLDLQNQSLQNRTYRMDAFQNLKHDLVLVMSNQVFREISETYDKINGLQYLTNIGDINASKYMEAIRAIERTLDLLK